MTATGEGRAMVVAGVVARLRQAGCVFAEDEARLLVAQAQTPDELAALVDRRVEGLPLEHVLGWARFCGLRIEVDPGVFVPRRRTEYLARRAIALAHPGAVAVDLCCGSGAVAAALLANVPNVDLHAVDIDPAAVRCARRNVEPAGGRVYLGDLYEALPDTVEGRVDVLIANAPYVPTEAIALMPPEARLHEPPVALDGGSDGLDVLRQIAEGAHQWLAPGGHLLVETSQEQADRLAGAIADQSLTKGLTPRITRSERLGATVIIARRRRPRTGRPQ